MNQPSVSGYDIRYRVIDVARRSHLWDKLFEGQLYVCGVNWVSSHPRETVCFVIAIHVSIAIVLLITWLGNYSVGIYCGFSYLVSGWFCCDLCLAQSIAHPANKDPWFHVFCKWFHEFNWFNSREFTGFCEQIWCVDMCLPWNHVFFMW